MTLSGWLSLTDSPDDTPLLCPEALSITGILSRTAALHHEACISALMSGTNGDAVHINAKVVRRFSVTEHVTDAATHLMWSYFLKRALYSTALCWSSTSIQLP